MELHMARKTDSGAEPASSNENKASTDERPSIPDPLGDDRHVRASGRLTSASPERQGLLGAGSEPLPDGGVGDHPVHDDDLEDLGPEEYEALTDAPETGLLRRKDEEIPDDLLDEEEEISALDDEESENSR